VVRRKAKKKHALKLDFVISLTPAECRDVLLDESARFDGNGTQTIGFEDGGRFWVERTIESLDKMPYSVRFEGMVTEVKQGTRVKGQITKESLVSIRHTIRRRRIKQFVRSIWIMVVPLVCYGSLLDTSRFLTIIGMVAVLLLMWLPLLMLFGLTDAIVEIKAPAPQLIGWLHKYLDYPLGDDNEPAIQSGEEAFRAAVPGFRDRTP
jgi:hypothetical protein